MQQSGRRLAEIPVSGSYLSAWQTAASSAAARIRPAAEPHLYYDLCKRALDVSIAAVLMLAAFPLLLVASLLIWVTTGESPILAQRRVGHLGEEFSMLKLRSMRRNVGDVPAALPTAIIAPKQ